MIDKKLKRYKVSVDSETTAISLVAEPAVEVDFVYMNQDEKPMEQVCLESNEKYLVVGPVLIPDKDIYRNNGEQEYYINFTKESVETMAQNYLKDFRQYNVKMNHESEASDTCMVESWIIADSQKDKAAALGFDLPVGTWMAAFKVNSINTWEAIKNGDVKGFSVESLVRLEDFNKAEEKNEDMFWSKLKNTIKDIFTETTDENLEEQQPEPAPEPTPTPEPEPAPEPQPEPEPEPSAEPEPQPAPEQPAPEPEKNDETNHLEDLIKSMRDEIAALKSGNEELQKKLTDALKKPSAAPINPNAGKGVTGDSFSEWRNAMRKML